MEEERLGARGDDVVDAMVDEVDADATQVPVHRDLFSTLTLVPTLSVLETRTGSLNPGPALGNPPAN